MKIMLITQEDAFYIPRLLDGLMPARAGDIIGITILRGETAKRNVRKYINFMGWWDFLRYGLWYAWYGVLDQLFPRGRGGHYFSVRGVARKYGIPVYEPDKVNSPEFLEQLKALQPDLIVSVAAPQIFKSELLRLPPLGCINIHNGLLPKYQGVLPSFWVLANNETETGTTVHYMNEKIDAGDIILQERVEVQPDDTLHALVYRTKVSIGPRLLLQAMDLIETGQVSIIPVDWSTATYFRFPDADAVRRFRGHGRRFG